MRKITIEINGSRKDVSDVFIRELFQRGIISPHTRIWRNGVEMQLRDAPDLMAPPPTYSAGGGFGSESGLSGLSSSSCQPTAPPLPPLPQFDGAGAYNRTYDPDVGATPKQSNRFFIFLWITATVIVLLLLGAFMAYKAQNSPKETTAEQEAIPNAEKAYEESFERRLSEYRADFDARQKEYVEFFQRRISELRKCADEERAKSAELNAKISRIAEAVR